MIDKNLFMLDWSFRTLALLAFGVVKPFTTDFSQSPFISPPWQTKSMLKQIRIFKNFLSKLNYFDLFEKNHQWILFSSFTKTSRSWTHWHLSCRKIQNNWTWMLDKCLESLSRIKLMNIICRKRGNLWVWEVFTVWSNFPISTDESKL